MLRIVVELPRNRDFCGALSVFGANGEVLCGPFPVAGRANDALASSRGNPGRNRLLRFGDTPTGTWRVRDILPSGRDTSFTVFDFGPNGVVVLEATGGEAALADANGRFQLLIQGGDASSENRLRATAGALRLSNDSLARLVEVLREDEASRCDVIDNDAMAIGDTVDYGDACTFDDPPLTSLTGDGVSSLDVTRRDALRVGAGGAVALNLAVSFVALAPTSARAHSDYVEVAYNSPPSNAGGYGTLGLYNQTSSNVSFESSVSLCVNSANVILNGACTSTQQAGTYVVTATRLDNGKKATKTITVPAGAEGSWSVTDSDF